MGTTGQYTSIHLHLEPRNEKGSNSVGDTKNMNKSLIFFYFVIILTLMACENNITSVPDKTNTEVTCMFT